MQLVSKHKHFNTFERDAKSSCKKWAKLILQKKYREQIKICHYTTQFIATLDSVLQGLHLCPKGKELCDGKKTSPEGHPIPTVTTARGH